MPEHTYTPQQLSRAFHHYLMERFDGDTNEVQPVFESAEQIIPSTLNEYFGTSLGTIYDLQDTDEIETLRRKIKADPMLKMLDRRGEPRYTEVLKWYRLFVKALHANTVPVPVPGEYIQPDDEGHRSQVSDGSNVSVAPTIKNTIFLEGEAAESQPKEIRQRNMQLRQVCIDYYRSLHGGRIVCECCGFDFREAYAIDDDYIEIHHRFPFAHTEGEHPVNSQTDLVPLCANCHRMIHHGQGGKGNCMSLEELKKLYKRNNKQKIL